LPRGECKTNCHWRNPLATTRRRFVTLDQGFVTCHWFFILKWGLLRRGLGLRPLLSYDRHNALIAGVEHFAREAPRGPTRRRRWWIFFLAWTIFAAVALWWLRSRSETPQSYSAWFGEGGGRAPATLLERAGNWLKLADLNFRRFYPWVLLSPYAAWLGARFLLERGRWRVSVPVHLLGGALFAAACHGLEEYADWGQPVFISVSTIAATNLDANLGQTNSLTTLTNITLLTSKTPGAISGGGGIAFLGGGHGSLPGGFGGGGVLPPGTRVGRKLVFRQRLFSSPLDLLDLFVYASLVGLVQTVHFHGRAKEREQRSAALEAQLTKARLNALQAQLHPHFLFNALNAISTLLRSDTRAAQEALASFSELLRLALNHSMHPEVTLREDLEFLARYVEIQQTRLSDRLRFEQVVPPEVMDCLVPALLLQPLVENAIRHGIEPSPNPGLVRVVVRSNADHLVLTVEDNGAGFSDKERQRSDGPGIGLQNLTSRLETLYGTAQRIDFGPRPKGGVIVTVEIPLRHAPLAQVAIVAS